MNRAQELFERLQRDGLGAINQFVSDAEAEQLFLDFKRSADNGIGTNLHQNDSKNLGKAISGFGNSDGGVIIWGVDSRISLSAHYPLADAAQFRARLEAAISRSTTPPHPGVVNHVIPAEHAPQGYVATLVPKAEFGPIRALPPGADGYFIRAGDSFFPIPHAVLEGLFGRRPIGKASIQLIQNVVGLAGGANSISIAAGMSVSNFGMNLLKRPYISIQAGNQTSRVRVNVHALDSNVSIRKSEIGDWQIYASPDVVVVPNGSQDLCRVALTIPVDSPLAEGFVLGITFGAENALPRQFSITVAPSTIEATVRTVRGGGQVNSGDVLNFADIRRQLQMSAQ